ASVVNDPPDGRTSGNVTVLPLVSLTATDTFVASGWATPLTVSFVATLEALTVERSKLVTESAAGAAHPLAPAGVRPIVSSLRPTRNTPSKFLAPSASWASRGLMGKSAVHVVGFGSVHVGGS